MTFPSILHVPLHALLPPPVYRPHLSGAYRVSPGLLTLERDFGNGPADRQVFQIDQGYRRHLENDAQARARGLEAYVASSAMDEALWATIGAFIVQRLTAEHPEVFTRTVRGTEQSLTNALTGETIWLDDRCAYLRGGRTIYRDGLDALAAQVQEDLAVCVVSETGDRLAAVHAVAPSHWDPSEKVGKSFNAIHDPVPGFDGIALKTPAMLRGLVKPTIYQRLGWSLADDDRLDRHPRFSEHFDPRGHSEGLFVRVERQTLSGFPAMSAFLFTIRVTFRDCAAMERDERQALASALSSMNPETLRYKGLDARLPGILARLHEDY